MVLNDIRSYRQLFIDPKLIAESLLLSLDKNFMESKENTHFEKDLEKLYFEERNNFFRDRSMENKEPVQGESSKKRKQQKLENF